LVVDLAQDVVARDRRVPAIDTAEYHDEIKSVAVASTRGVDIEQKIGFLEIWSDALGEDTGVKAAEDAYQVGRSLADIRVDRLAAEAVQRTVDLLASEVSCPSELPIVFDPLVVADFLNAIGKGLSGGAMSSGRSPFASQQGMSVAPPWLELVDDGISPLFRTAAVYDDEGLPRRRTSLVKAGVLSGVMHSTVTARAMSNGASTTGNARRGSYKTVPKASPHCLVLTPTATRDAVIASAGRALYIQQLAGAGAGIDPITGRVEVGGVGWLLDDGQNVGRLPVVPISTTLPTFLRSITAVGDDTYQAASLPTAGCTVMCGSELLRGVGLN
jgi:predicted Zn-dependent protease